MSLTLLSANNAQSVIASGISASATSVSLATGTGDLFPSPASGVNYFKLTFVDAATEQITEIVHVTSRSGDTLTIERAQEGTTARAWSVNDIAANMMTAGSLSILAQYDTAEFKSATHGRLINTQVITSTGNYTPTEGTEFIRVRAIAAGGGSAGCQATSATQTGGCPSGYHGQFIEVIIPVSAFTAPVPVTIGLPGNGGTGVSGTTGTAAGNTSFGGIFTLGGGPAGTSGTVGTGALISGVQYLPGQTFSSTITPLNGTNGVARNAQFMQVTAGVATGYSAPLSPMEGGYYGSGGEGVYMVASSPRTPGLSGRAGIMIIDEYA